MLPVKNQCERAPLYTADEVLDMVERYSLAPRDKAAEFLHKRQDHGEKRFPISILRCIETSAFGYYGRARYRGIAI